MNRLEFNEIMKAANIKNNGIKTNGRYGSMEDIYCWNNLTMCFGGSYYAVVNGRIPLEVANNIYEKYPNNPHNIRIEGGSVDSVPFNYAIDDKFEEDIKEYYEQNMVNDDFNTYFMNAKNNLEKRNDDDKYITSYHIDTKEGLVVFLKEMSAYLSKSNKETEDINYDDLANNVSFEILKKINPSISAYEWMQDDEANKDNYNRVVERDNKTYLGQIFRNAILDFDKAVNPYTDENIELDEIGNYSKKVSISANLSDEVDGRFRKECCSLNIKDLNTNNSTTYYRCPDGFSFQLMCKYGDEQYLNVLHYYTSTGQCESDRGEIIGISYYGENIENKIDIRLNLTNGTVGPTYGFRTDATPESFAFVYDELVKATEYAKEITVKNMAKKSMAKSLF